MRYDSSKSSNPRTWLVLPLFLVGSALIGCSSSSTETEPGAVAETSKQEIEGTHDPSDLDPITAQRWIDNVHLGRTVDESGKIAFSERSDDFAAGDAAFLSMEVTDAAAGSKVLVSVVDATTESEIWSDSKTVEAGKSHLVFELDPGALGEGEYRADVYVGDERVARRDFDVNA